MTPPPAPPAVVRAEGQVLVSGLIMLGGPPYLWSPDGGRVAFHHESGIWSLSPDGAAAEALVSGPAHREPGGFLLFFLVLYGVAEPLRGYSMPDWSHGLDAWTYLGLSVTVLGTVVGAMVRMTWGFFKHLRAKKI